MKRRFPTCLIALIALPFLSAVEIGQTLDQVLAEKGKPGNRLQTGATTILTYGPDRIKLKEGKVVEIKAVADLAPASSTPAGPAIPAGTWTTNPQAALAQARDENKKVFLFFTGSDWCGWCKRLDAEILTTPKFKEYASENLILVKLDFPRGITQPAALKLQNRKLAEKHGVSGFPTVVVLNGNGDPVGELGYMEGGPAPFVKKLQSL